MIDPNILDFIRDVATVIGNKLGDVIVDAIDKMFPPNDDKDIILTD